MKKIVHRQDVENLSNLPVEISAKAEEIAGILDTEYGADRHWEKDLGGCVLIGENAEDVDVMDELIDFEYVMPEFVKLIRCKDGENYTNSLMILSSDYSITLLLPMSLTPKILLDSMEADLEREVRS
jgi:hypothetical protein